MLPSFPPPISFLPVFESFERKISTRMRNIFNEKMRNRKNDGQNDTRFDRRCFIYRSSSEWGLETRATERKRARVQPNVATRVHWRNSWSEGAGLNRFNPSSQHPTPSRILLSKNSEFPLESIGVDSRKHLGRRGLAEFLERLVV